MATFTGLDILARQRFDKLRRRAVALLCNQASVAKDLTHASEVFLAAHKAGLLTLKAIFGPQHGLFGHTQDNMVEWEGGLDSRLGVPVYSLYGEHREATDEMLEGIEAFVVDLQDVGARYYTFIWTMALCMRSCERLRIPMLVLDRPNPIGGLQVEGPVMESKWASFVGLRPLPARHGMTVAEVAKYLRAEFYPELALDFVTMEGWSRSDYFDDLDLPWVAPSPNMPSVNTACVYPGMCLLEGTNLSEGRGTTRPFETFGAPWLNGWRLADSLNSLELPGARFRAVEFEPTFQKHKGQVCGGCFIHVVDRRAYDSVLTAIAILRECHLQDPDRFGWKEPPYEYEHERRPIDLLFGNDWLASLAISEEPLNAIQQRLMVHVAQFRPLREKALLYVKN